MIAEITYESKPVTDNTVSIYTIGNMIEKVYIDGRHGGLYLEMVFNEPREIVVIFTRRGYHVKIHAVLGEQVSYNISVKRRFGKVEKRVEITGTLSGSAADAFVNQLLSLAERVVRG